MGFFATLKMLVTGKEPLPTPKTPAEKLADEIASIRRMAGGHGAPLTPPPGEDLNPRKPVARARIRPGTHGAKARFTYTNSKGETTTREIHNWVSEADYVTGDCQLRGVELTFNKRRIDNWEVL